MITRTFDSQLVQKVLGHPTLKRRSDIKNLGIFDPENQKDLYYLIVSEGNEVLGLLVFHPQNRGCYQGHVNYLPRYWGSGLEKYTKEAIEWMFTNADCEKIFAFIPDKFPEIKKHSIKAGMVEEGLLTNSYRVGDDLYSQTIMGISKQ